jgi:LPXTG-site transpeptidase (sortase) family protein
VLFLGGEISLPAAVKSFHAKLNKSLTLSSLELAPAQLRGREGGNWTVNRSDKGTNWQVGVLRIPSIEIEVPVLEGTDDLVLNRAVGHIDGTAAPGEEGNIGIAGHRDGFFRGLKDVHVGEYLDLYTERGNTRYIVDDIRIVPPEDVSVLAPRPRSSITLVTCYPFYFVGSAPLRYIVHASTTSAINLRAPRPQIHSEDRGVRDPSSVGGLTD